MDIVALTIRPPLAPEDLPGLFARVCALLEEHEPRRVRCHVSGVAADAVSLDALARLRLATRRCDCRLELHGSSPDLGAFLAFAGLSRVLS